MGRLDRSPWEGCEGGARGCLHPPTFPTAAPAFATRTRNHLICSALLASPPAATATNPPSHPLTPHPHALHRPSPLICAGRAPQAIASASSLEEVVQLEKMLKASDYDAIAKHLGIDPGPQQDGGEAEAEGGGGEGGAEGGGGELEAEGERAEDGDVGYGGEEEAMAAAEVTEEEEAMEGAEVMGEEEAMTAAVVTGEEAAADEAPEAPEAPPDDMET